MALELTVFQIAREGLRSGTSGVSSGVMPALPAPVNAETPPLGVGFLT